MAGNLIPAFAYLRVSGKGQIDGDGFDRQLIACETYAAANGFQIIEVFKEEGVSGTKDLENRPALQELLAALVENGTKTVLIEKLDRLARDLMVQETIIADMRKQGHTLISALEPDLCSQDPSRKLVRQMFGAIAEYEREMLVLKLRGARLRMKSKTGRCEGRKPYGQTPEEMAVILDMRRWRQAGYLHSQIADRLNVERIPTRLNGIWHGGTVSKILRKNEMSPFCAGNAPAEAHVQ